MTQEDDAGGEFERLPVVVGDIDQREAEPGLKREDLLAQAAVELEVEA